jgi:hypothetical protein
VYNLYNKSANTGNNVKLIKERKGTNSKGDELLYTIHEIEGASKPFEVKRPGMHPRRYKTLKSATKAFD